MALLGGCDDRFVTPSAYDQAPDVCGDSAARAAVLEACQAAGDCGGVIGFSGTLEGRDVRVGAGLEAARFTDARTPEGVVVDGIEAIGESPYFKFVLKVQSIGGGVDLVETDVRELTTNRASDTAPDRFTDDTVSLELRLTTTSESEAFGADDGGVFVIDDRSADGLSGTFAAAFGEDELSGCYSFSPTSRTTVVVTDG